MIIRWDNQPEEDQPLSLFQWLRRLLGMTYCQYPKWCQICGMPTKGNRITGYSFRCDCSS